MLVRYSSDQKGSTTVLLLPWLCSLRNVLHRAFSIQSFAQPSYVQPSHAETRQSDLRILIIQHKGNSAEAKVVFALVSAMQREIHVEDLNAVMLVQFGREYLPDGKRFLTIPGCDVVSVDIGGSLGERQPRQRQALELARLALAFPRIVARARAFHPDLIYTSQQRWDVRLAILVAGILRRPYVMHLHYLPGSFLGADVIRWLRKCALVICVSKFIQQKAVEAGVPAERTTVIRNMLPPSAVASNVSREEARKELCGVLGIPTTDVLVGMVARVAPGKGQIELVRSMAPILAQENANCRLILVGSETYPEAGYAREMLETVEREGVTDRVHWLGKRTNVPDLLRAFDVFAHPSYDEPCGLSVIEALLAGLPTIVWRDGGPAELLVDGETGMLVETGNIQALTEALATLCKDAAMREQMRQAALATTARVGNTAGAAQLYHDALAGVAFRSR